MNVFLEKKLYLFTFSIILISASLFGSHEIPVRHLLSNLDFVEIYNLLIFEENIFRPPDTVTRFSLFFVSIVTMFFCFIIKSRTDSEASNVIKNIISSLSLVFFVTLLITEDIYNITAVLLISFSIYYVIFYGKKNFNRYEIILLVSYLLIFLYPFYTSLFHLSTLSEMDNYLRFLAAIPIYITLREIDFDLKLFLLSISLGSLLAGFLAIYQYIFFIGPVSVYSSSTSVFASIILLFSLITIMSVPYFKNNKLVQYFLYLSSSVGLIGWMLTGQRGLLIVLIFFILYLFFTKSKSLLWTNKKPLVFMGSILIIFSFFSPLSDRITNSFDSTYNYIINNSKHSWKQEDSIIPRISIWKASINMIGENGLYGVGLNNFNESLEAQISSKKINPIRNSALNKSAGMNHAHNQYLDIYVKTGILGLLTLLIFIFGHIKYFSNGLSLDKSDDNLVSLIGLLSIYIFSIIMLFQTFLAHQQLILFMCLLLTVLSSIKSNLKYRSN